MLPERRRHPVRRRPLRQRHLGPVQLQPHGGRVATTATQGQSSGGSSTASGVNTSGQTYTSSGSNSFSQGTFQSQSGTVTEQGTYAGGSYALAETLDFTAQGSDSFNAGSSSGDTYTGSTSGHDASSANARRPGQLVGVGRRRRLRSYGGVRGSRRCRASRSTPARRRATTCIRPGWRGRPPTDTTTSGRRRRRWARRGRTTPPPAPGPATAPARLGLLQLRRLDHLDGDPVRLLRRRQRQRLRQRRRDGDGRGAGNAGTSVETASGYYKYDSARSDLAPTTLSTAVVLTGPTLPGLGAVGAPANWMLNPGNGLWTPAASLTAIAGQLTGRRRVRPWPPWCRPGRRRRPAAWRCRRRPSHDDGPGPGPNAAGSRAWRRGRC